MNSFYVWWAVSFLFLMLFSGWIGKKAVFKSLDNKGSIWGILIDNRERYSLNRFQLIMWTILILSTLSGLLITNLDNPGAAIKIPIHLLGLLGISVGSATVSGAVKDSKDKTRPSQIGGGTEQKDFGASLNQENKIKPIFAQVILEEEGGQANKIVSISKFQNFIFTVSLGLIYIVLTIKAGSYPSFDEQILWLIGISQAGYVGGKVPDKK